MTSKSEKMAKLSKKIGKRCSKSQMARFMARNSKWPENIFYGQRGANMARFEKSGHQMANLAALFSAALCLLQELYGGLDNN